jgi:hypothetical protein
VSLRKRVHVAVVVVAALAAAIGVRGQGPGPDPILVVLNDSAPNPFGAYLPEILRAEGINTFDVVQLSAIDAPTLGAAALVVLAETPLTAPQATLFSNYVAAGGRLVAMRPDPQLAGVLGIGFAGGTVGNGYLLVNQSGPGAGLQNLTLPFKGLADQYTLAGGTAVADLYSTRTLSANRPAVVKFNRTATWSFDLARSTAYVRQGDPAFAGLDRDGQAGYRTNDIFYQTIDLERVGVPHADVQMRLFSRVVADLLADSRPLPRLWYFPGTNRTVLIPTGDSHSGNPGPYASLIAKVESVGARMSIYLSRFIDLSSSPVATWVANGHEVAVHPFFEPDGLTGNFPAGYAVAFDWFATGVPVPSGPTVRHHSLEWGGWVDPVSVMVARGLRMDLSYYPWGPALNNPTLASQAHGYITGSALPMRFVTAAGQVLPVYQQVTALADEQMLTGTYSEGLTPAQALAVSRQLIDDSQAGGYSAITTQFHVDAYVFGEVGPWVDGTLDYAASLQLPMWTAARWLRFVEARAATSITDMVWTPGTGQLSFGVTVPAGAEPQSVTLPQTFAGRVFASLTIDGLTVAPTLQAVNGLPTQFFTVAPQGGSPRQVVAQYTLPAGLPTLSINDVSVPEGNAGSSTATLTVTLSPASANDVTVQFATSNGTATAGADYTATSGTLTFTAGTTSRPVPVTILGDAVYEAAETVVVTLSNPVGATLADATGTVTIGNDDAEPQAFTDSTIADFSVCSVASGTRVGPTGDVRLLGTFRDTFDAASLDPRWISGAWDGSPYTPVPAGGVLSLGNATGAFIRSAAELPVTTLEVRAAFAVLPFQSIGVADDAFNTRYARFNTLAAGTNLWATTDPGTGMIGTDLGPIPAGAHNFSIERIAQGATELIRYRIDGVAVADHVITTGQLPAARYLFLSHNGGASPTLNIDTVETDPPFTASGTFVGCTVDALTVMAWHSLTWDATVPGTGSLTARTRTSIDGVTWSAWSGPLTTSGSAITSPAGRYLQYQLDLATSTSTSGPVVNAVTVNAAGPAPPVVSIGNAAVTEGPGAAAAFTASLSWASPLTVSATYTTAGGTAASGLDFTAGSGPVSFAPGATTQVVNVPVVNDALDEDAEAFTVTLSAPVNGSLGTATGTATITDDDAPPALSVSGVAVAEGDSGTVNAVFPVTLSAASGKTVSVAFTTAAGTATAGVDFVAANGSLTFDPGVTSRSITVVVNGDILVEANEAFTVTLSSPGAATIAVPQATGTITNDDVLPTAVADGYATPPNTPLVVAAPGVLGNDTNDGGGAMTAALVSGVAHGTLSLAANGGFTYTPTASYVGTDSFVYQVSDGGGTGNTATVTLAIGLNPPTAAADAYATPFDTALTVAAPGVLANDDAHSAPGLTAVLVSNVAHGVLTLGANGSVLYTPDTGFAGEDSFTYRADSVAGAGGTATVTIAVGEPTSVQPPKALRVSAIAGTSVTFRWQAPAVGPTPVGYALEGGVLPSQTLASFETGLAAPIFTVVAPPGSFYVRVRSLGPGGPSAVSNEILVHVSTAVAPSAPTALQATASGSTLHLAWTPTFQGGAGTGAVLDVTGSLAATLPLPAVERISFAGVPAGTYALTVREVNAGGSSAPSAPLLVTVPGVCAGAPEPPRNVLAYVVAGTSFLVWDPPATGDAPTSYLVTVPGFGVLPTGLRALSGVLPAGTYPIEVRAVGACGNSVAASVTLTVP